MILLLDCGNTLVKFACLKDGHRNPAIALAYDELDNLPRHIKHTPSQVFGANVASQTIKNRLEQACLGTWGLTIQWCDSSCGKEFLHSNYAKSLGPDRWLASLGLLQHVQHSNEWLSGQPHILASFGTATTIDTISLITQENKQYAYFHGGLILPGAEMMRTSLAAGTAGLPLAHGAIADFPLDTFTAINSGIIAAQSGALYRQWQKARQLGPGLEPQIYISGGAWPAISASILADLTSMHKFPRPDNEIVRLIETPVLDGLAMLAMQN